MKKLIILLITFCSLVSCSDSFLETTNHNTLDVSSFLKTANDLQYALNASYTPLAGNGMFGLQYVLMFNSLDPYIVVTDGAPLVFDNFNYNPTTPAVYSMYKELYYGLFRTSDILAKMSQVKTLVSQTTYEQTEAQLKALRGLYYFYLVTVFDKPVYYDETNVPSNPLIGLKNGTQEQFWNKLEEDLTSAADKLPISWGSADKGRITKGAANALLGKALLYKHYHYYLRFGKGNIQEANANLIKAKNALYKVMDGTYQLIQPAAAKTKDDYQAALLSNFSFIDIPVGTNTYDSENNSESIWEVQFNDNPGTNVFLPGWASGGNMFYQYFSPYSGSYRNHLVAPTLWNEFEDAPSSHLSGQSKDPRAYATCYLDGDIMDWRSESGYKIPYDATVNGKADQLPALYASFSLGKGIGLKKYYYPQFTTNSTPSAAPMNFRVIRYDDLLLMYAEACLKSNTDLNLGLNALNLVRARVDMPAVSTLTHAAIVHERNVELATECIRYNDLVRWSYDTDFALDMGAIFSNMFKDKNHYFPIPQAEIDINQGALVQNIGW